MMGQQQVNRISAKRYLEEAEKLMLKQADAYYVKEHFRVGSDYDKDKFVYAQLYRDILCTDDCTILNWVDKKIRGALEKEDIQIVDLKTLQTKKRDITINNYYNLENEWQSPIEW